VEIRPPTAMKRITRPAHPGPAVFPTTHSSDVRAPLVGEKHVSAPVETLCVSLQAAGARCQRGQVGIVSHHHKDIDISRIRLGRHDRAPREQFVGRLQSVERTRRIRADRREGGSGGPQRELLSLTPQSSNGTSLNGTRTSIERGRPGVRLIKPHRSSVTIMLCTDGGVTLK
jgi:hypothetical protein